MADYPPTGETDPRSGIPANFAFVVRKKSAGAPVTAKLYAEPDDKGGWTFQTYINSVPAAYGSLMDLTPMRKLPAGTVVIGSPQWDAVVAKYQKAAAAATQPS